MRPVWIRSLRQEWLNVDVRVNANAMARIVERPGLWMSEAEQDDLVVKLRQIAAATLKQSELQYGVLTGNRQRLSDSIITLVYERSSGRPIAFNALAIMPVELRGESIEVLHLGLVMVDPTARSTGLSWILYGMTCVLLLARNQFRPLWISNVTQVPAIVGMVSETFSDVYPSPTPTARCSFNHLALARQIMARHRHVFGVGADADFSERSFVIANAYTGGSDHLMKPFADATKHREGKYNDMCAAALDYVRGDDFLQIGRIDLHAMQRYVIHTVPRESVMAICLGLALDFCRTLVLPPLHWFDARQRWGILRPWSK